MDDYTFEGFTRRNEQRNRESIVFLQIARKASLYQLRRMWRAHLNPDADEWKLVVIARAFERKGLPVPE